MARQELRRRPKLDEQDSQFTELIYFSVLSFLVFDVDVLLFDLTILCLNWTFPVRSFKRSDGTSLFLWDLHMGV
jgi:hypothetical protein